MSKRPRRAIMGFGTRLLIASTIVASAGVGLHLTPLAQHGPSYAISVANGTFAQTTTGSVTAAGNGAAATDMWVWATCFQNGNLVYWENPHVDSGLSVTLTLGPTASWTGGAASCSADLKTWDVKRAKWVVLAHTTFGAAG